MSESWSELQHALEAAIREALLDADRQRSAPGALRTVLTGIELEFRARCLASPAVKDAEFEALMRRIETLVELEVSEHAKRVRPAPGLGQIFANAHATSVKLGEERTQVDTRKCKGCGAARPDDARLTSCSFCGRSFFSEGGGA